jgi:hypothetical protein
VVDISGWVISSIVGSQVFVFPQGTMIQPGATTTVWSGKESDLKNHPPNSFFWTKRYIWKDSGDVAALYNAAHKLVSSASVFPFKVPAKIKL